MRQFKVIALSVGGQNNKIYKSQDVVSESAFPKGHADALVKDGFLKEIKSSKAEDKSSDKTDDKKSTAKNSTASAKK